MDDDREVVTFFCGGSRNLASLVGLFDLVVVLEVTEEVLRSRLASRPVDEFGSRPEEMEFVLGLWRSRAEIPAGAVSVDATPPLAEVVDAVVRLTQLAGR